MKKFLSKLMLLAALLVPLGAHATTDTLVVADGTATSTDVPIYGYYADVSQHNQVIYPASMLTDMVGQNITGLSFFVSGGWSCPATVSMAIVTDSTLTGLVTNATLTQVWQGTWSSSTQMVFSNAFAYTGGHLLIDIQTTGSQYANSSATGIATNGYVSYNGYYDNTYQFLPKAQFVYSDEDFCFMPVIDSVVSTGTDASVYFHAGGTETDWIIRLAGGTWDDVYSSPYTFTGLTASSFYTVELAAVCSSGDSSLVTSQQFHTECATISDLPYTENFEGLATGYSSPFHPCWTRGAAAGDLPPYVYQDDGSGWYQMFTNTTHQLLFNGEDGDVWAVLPTIDDAIEVSDLEMTIDLDPSIYASNSYYEGYYSFDFLVGVIDSTDYVVGASIDTIAYYTAVSLPETKYVSFANYTGTGKNIIFLAPYDDNAYYGSMMAVDNVNLYVAPQCPRPDSLTVVAADSNELELSWVADASATDFLVEWRSSDTAAWNSDNATSTSIVIGNLTPNTLYTVRVRTLCSGDTSTAAIGQFRTNCANITAFPWTEGFEADGALACWKIYDFDGNSSDNWTLSEYYSNSGTWAAYSSFNSYDVGTNWLVSTAIDLPSDMDNPVLSWYVLGRAWQTNQPHYSVRVSTTSYTDTLAFTTLFDESRDDDPDTDPFEKRTLSLAQYAGQTIYVAFVRDAGDDYFLAIDDISIYESQEPVVSIVGSAAAVTGLTATYAAHLDEGATDGLTYAWHSVRAAAGTATVNTVAPDTVTLLYTTVGPDTLRLIATNTYGADTTYLYINAVSINYTALPFSTGFEANDDNAWTFANAGTNNWVIDTAVHVAGSRALYISNDNGAHNAYTISNYAYSFVYRAFNFATAGTYGIDFDWRNLAESSASYDYVRVYLAPVTDSIQGASSYSAFNGIPATWVTLVGSLTGSAEWQHHSSTFAVAAPGVYNLVFYWYNDGSVGTNPPAAIDNLSLQAISCPAPTALVIDSVTTTTAAFHWTAGAAETSWQVQVGNLAPVTVTDTFYTATGLTPATNYNIAVRGICGAGDTSFALSGGFWTECDIFQVPYYIHFEGGMLNTCWSNVHTGSVAPSTAWANSLYSSSYGSASYIYSYAPYSTTPVSDYLISPAIHIPATDTAMLRIVLRVAGYPSSYNTPSEAKYEVLVSPTGADSVAAFTDTLWTEVIDTSNFIFRYIPVSAYAGQDIRFAIRNVSYRYGEVAVYDAAVRRVNEPLYYVYGDTTAIAGDTNIYTAERVEGDMASMTLSWTSLMAAAGQATILGANTDTMRIVYSAAGIDTVTFIAHNNYGADTTRFPVHVYQCDVITVFPWTEGFEDAGVINCWWQEGPSTWTVGTGTTSSVPTAHSGTKNVRITHSITGNVTKLITPVLNLSAMSTPLLTFWHVQKVWSGDQDMLKVYYRTAANAPWQLLATYDTNIADWTLDSILLPSPSATYQIAFEMVDGYGYGVGIDDITIGATVVGCPAPSVAVTDTTETSVSISINGTAADYEVACVAGTWVAPAAGTAISTTTYTFNGLTDGTAYAIGVRAVCDAGNYSPWTVVNVTTPQHNCIMPTGLMVTGLTSNGGTISWTAGEAGQTDFQVNIYTTTVNDTLSVQGTTHTFTNLYAGTSYNVRVRAVCSATNFSEWTAPVVLTPTTCPAPTGVAASAQGNTVNVSWDDMQVDQYRVEWYDEGFTNNGHNMTVTTNSATITDLEGGQAYDIYVYAYCSATDVSAASTVVTVQVLGIDDVNSSLINLYPNPANTTVTVDGITGEALVTIVDMNGRTVYSEKAVGKLTIDLSGMAQGAYFVRITGENTTAIRKLIVK